MIYQDVGPIAASLNGFGDLAEGDAGDGVARDPITSMLSTNCSGSRHSRFRCGQVSAIGDYRHICEAFQTNRSTCLIRRNE